MDRHRDQRQLIPLNQARDILGVSHTTMARLVKEEHFTIYQNPLDRRQKLVDMREIEAFASPVPVSIADSVPIVEAEPVPPPSPPMDDQLRHVLQLLESMRAAEEAAPDAPFVQSRSGDIFHPGLESSQMTFRADDFNRLQREGHIRVLPGVYHRLGDDMGREIVITQAGLDALAAYSAE